MTPREKGFLLLTSHLGIPERRVLTSAQLRDLTRRMENTPMSEEDRELERSDLRALGYGDAMAERILALLAEEEQLDYYLMKGARLGCSPVTRISSQYPLILRKRLGGDSPGCLWAKGETALLEKPGIALVGSRELNPENRTFAEAVGHRAAEHGLVLISGNARGADRAAQDACLAAGGQVISVVADQLERHSQRDNVLYISEDGYDFPFSSLRAHSRNRVIHAMGRMVFAAQADLGSGGTWAGVSKNLSRGWSSVACFRDGSEAMRELEQMGAFLVDTEDLTDLAALLEPQQNLFD